MGPHLKVLLVGGGGIGVIAALSLEASAQVKVTIVLRSNYNTVVEKGYDITSCDHGRLRGWRPAQVTNHVPVVSTGETPFDYIVITAKNVPSDGVSMADTISPAVTPEITTLVLIQNGLNVEVPYLARFPQNVILSGVSYAGSQELQYGTIFHGSHDSLEIGAFRNCNTQKSREIAAAKHFVSLYAASGKASCQFAPHVQHDRWRKLVYNATINPLCAITALDTGSLRRAGPFVSKLLEDGMAEIIAVAAAAGHIFPKALSQELLDLDPMEDRFEPSMLQDAKKVGGHTLRLGAAINVTKGNSIEYEYLVGEPLREGIRLNISMPTISVLYALCEAIQFKNGAKSSKIIRISIRI
ncbi:hypothetical protein D0868_09006 [Hortaea werneckii]|uniref:2-dehydropantoate 2-reductase n=1 Tax=Hortaea werneckii TaxID=91943 RepID=A0A3M6YBM8_HORWE|nr:hypothetical protein D0868_09006 [Hortaea werneckii]